MGRRRSQWRVLSWSCFYSNNFFFNHFCNFVKCINLLVCCSPRNKQLELSKEFVEFHHIISRVHNGSKALSERKVKELGVDNFIPPNFLIFCSFFSSSLYRISHQLPIALFLDNI